MELETSVANAGAALESKVQKVGRCWSDVWNAASGAGSVDRGPRVRRKDFADAERLLKRLVGTAADPELCAQCRTASLAHCTAPEVPLKRETGRGC
jgi:hypothetical protein